MADTITATITEPSGAPWASEKIEAITAVKNVISATANQSVLTVQLAANGMSSARDIVKEIAFILPGVPIAWAVAEQNT